MAWQLCIIHENEIYLPGISVLISNQFLKDQCVGINEIDWIGKYCLVSKTIESGIFGKLVIK